MTRTTPTFLLLVASWMVGSSPISHAADLITRLPPPYPAVATRPEYPLTQSPGLLGKRYFQFSFSLADDLVNRRNSNQTAFAFSVNLPIWQSFDQRFGVDLHLYGSQSEYSNSPLNSSLVTFTSPFEVKGERFQINSTIFYNGEKIRPFLMLGYEHATQTASIDLNSLRGFNFQGETISLRDTEDSFGFRVGYELDVAPRLAWRNFIGINPTNNYEDNVAVGEFVFWPTDRVFFKAGLAGPLSGDAIAGRLGVGIRF
jgi:hypothetical protein